MKANDNVDESLHRNTIYEMRRPMIASHERFKSETVLYYGQGFKRRMLTQSWVHAPESLAIIDIADVV